MQWGVTETGGVRAGDRVLRDKDSARAQDLDPGVGRDLAIGKNGAGRPKIRTTKGNSAEKNCRAKGTRVTDSQMASDLRTESLMRGRRKQALYVKVAQRPMLLSRREVQD